MTTGCLMAAAICAALAPGSLNDLSKTPGDVRTTDKALICGQRTKTIRSVSPATRRQVFAAYGMTNHTGWCAPGSCELDHLIPLELGGSNSAKNLWPQPYYGEWNAYRKDRLETRLHWMVCNGIIAPVEAQRVIARDWISAYKMYLKP